MNPLLPAANLNFKTAGFTLVELIIVITLTGVVAVMSSTIISNQMQGYVDTSRRAALTGKVDMALRHVARDLRNGIPYSIRISGSAIEWVPIEGFGRYRQYQTAGSGNSLDFFATDDGFDVFGNLPTVSAGTQIVISNSNVNASGFNIFQDISDGTLLPIGSHVISPASTTVTAAVGSVSLSTPFQFSQDSVANRFYVINGAASYLCDTSSGQIIRYDGYSLQMAQPINASVAPLSTAANSLLVDSVSECSFGYTALDLQHGIVTVRISITEDNESVTLVRFIHVENQS